MKGRLEKSSGCSRGAHVGIANVLGFRECHSRVESRSGQQRFESSSGKIPSHPPSLSEVAHIALAATVSLTSHFYVPRLRRSAPFSDLAACRLQRLCRLRRTYSFGDFVAWLGSATWPLICFSDIVAWAIVVVHPPLSLRLGRSTSAATLSL